jgi:hypothetical protein
MAPIRNSLEQQDFSGMLSTGYFHPFLSRVAVWLPTSSSSRAKFDKKFSRLLNCNAQPGNAERPR